MKTGNSVQSVSQALKSYLASCKANGLAKGTIENYERVVSEYVKFLYDKGYEEATIGSASDWKIAMNEKGTKINVVSSKMHMAKAFFDWAIEMEILEKNPFIPTVMPSRKAVNAENHKPYTKLLSAEEFARILHSGRPKGVPMNRWYRNRAILIVLLTSGLRNSELRDLTLNDLDFENSTITVRRGKGNKSRVCSFPTIAQTAVKDYLTSGYRPLNVTADDYLFGVTDENGYHQFERNSLSQMVELEIEKITGREKCKTHSLRHASASYLLSSGVSVDSISALLGHSSVSTTAIYAERLNPKAPSTEANNVFEKIVDIRMV